MRGKPWTSSVSPKTAGTRFKQDGVWTSTNRPTADFRSPASVKTPRRGDISTYGDFRARAGPGSSWSFADEKSEWSFL